MAFTGTSLLSLPIITTGTESGAWGNITNNGLTQYLDTSIAGALSITSSITLANTSGDASGTNLASTTAQYRTLVVPASGPSANIVITAPSSNRTYHVVNRNATYTVQIRAGANSGVTLDVNQSATVTYNSTSNDYELVGVVGSTTGTATATKFIPTGNVTAGNGMYLPAANTLAWSNNGSETMRIDSSGNVGIGTNSPSSKLSVVGAGYFQVAGGSGNYGTNITCYSGGGDIALNTGTNSSGYAYQTVATNHAFVFGTNNTERMRIDSGGNVGIGTSSPVAKLDIISGTARMYFSNQSATAFFTAVNTSNSAYAPMAINGSELILKTGDAERARIDSSGNVGIGTSSPSAKLSVSDGTTRIDLSPFGGTGYVGTQTNHAVGFITNNTERARITSSGTLCVACTAVPNVSSGQTGFSVSSSEAVISVTTGVNDTVLYLRSDSGATKTPLSFWNGTTLCGTVSTTSSGTTAYNTSSDYRLKNTIAPMTGALAKVAQLKPVTYKWNTDGSDGQGFIAHELQEVAPYAVTGEKDGEQMQGVDYGKLTPILTAALQEAIAKIETLEARIAVLEAK